MDPFGQEDLQCGIQHTKGFSNEYFLFFPYLLFPVNIYLIIQIIRHTPFIAKVSVIVYCL